MRKTLQILLEGAGLAEVRRAARLSRMMAAEWVRHALRRARRDQSTSDARRQLMVVREAARGSYPTGDIDQMLAEIGGGYLGERS